jgi:hypothetical protein
MKDRQHLRILANVWGLRNWCIAGKRDRAIRWFALADKYQD